MATINDYVDLSGETPAVTVEHEYAYVDTLEWFGAVARDVTDYWQEIVARCARDGDSDGRWFDSIQSVSTRDLREARDRVVKALQDRADTTGYSTNGFHGHTSNSDNNFYHDFGYSVAPLFRGGWEVGYLIFVSMGDYVDNGLDHVFQVDDWEDAYRVLDPELGYYCTNEEHPEEWGDRREYGRTRNGGYSFEVGDDMHDRTDVIADGLARCSMGHEVEIYVETSW